MALTAAFPLSTTQLAHLSDARLATLLTQFKNDITSIEGWIVTYEADGTPTVPATITWNVAAGHVAKFNDARLVTMCQDVQTWCEEFHAHLEANTGFVSPAWSVTDAELDKFPIKELHDALMWCKTELDACKVRWDVEQAPPNAPLPDEGMFGPMSTPEPEAQTPEAPAPVTAPRRTKKGK